MRQSELLGLKWGDVDLARGVLRVRRTVWQGVATAPKTAKANRSIRLTGMAQEALKALKARKARTARKGAEGEGWEVGVGLPHE